jgi:LysM repeat protein
MLVLLNMRLLRLEWSRPRGAQRVHGRRCAGRRAGAAPGWVRAVAVTAAVATVGAVGAAGFGGRYVVRSGDTVDAIAARLGTTPAELAAANQLSDPDNIYAGQVLAVPQARYRVAPGDNLAGIARRFGVPVDALAAANAIADRNRILVGQVLVIPGSAGRAVGAATTSVAARSAGPLAAVPTPAGGAPRFPDKLRAHPSRVALRPLFQRWARRAGVPAGLLEAMCWMESGWQQTVVSPTGAIGVGQLEPSTVVFTSRVVLGLPRALDARNVEANIELAAFFLAWTLQRAHGDVATALGGYYQGLSSVVTTGPLPATRHYVLVVGELWGLFRSG